MSKTTNLVAKNIILDIVKDFESFFINEYKVILDFGQYHGLSIKGTGSKARIKIPNDFSNMEVNDDETLVYILFLMGHELAHHINKHNSFITNTAEEHRAIETWADFFGVSISLTILFYDTNFRKHIINTYDSNDDYIRLVLRVFDKLYQNVYINNSKKYESPEYRLNTVFVGIVSWIVKMEMTRNFFSKQPKDIQEIYRDTAFHWNLRLIKLISENKNSMTYNVLIFMKALDDLDTTKKKVSLIYDIHKKISKNSFSITSGVKLEFVEILNTSFGINSRQEKLFELMDELDIKH